MPTLPPAPDSFEDRRFRPSLKVVQSGDVLEIRQRWIRLDDVLLALVAPFPFHFILSLAFAGLRTGELFWMLGSLVVILLILALAYALAAHLLNVSILRVTQGRLELRSRPIPFLTTRRAVVLLEWLGGISWDEKIHLAYEYRRRSVDYRLHLSAGSGKRLWLLRPFRKKEEAERIRAMIVDYLKRGER